MLDDDDVRWGFWERTGNMLKVSVRKCNGIKPKLCEDSEKDLTYN